MRIIVQFTFCSSESDTHVKLFIYTQPENVKLFCMTSQFIVLKNIFNHLKLFVMGWFNITLFQSFQFWNSHYRVKMLRKILSSIIRILTYGGKCSIPCCFDCNGAKMNSSFGILVFYSFLSYGNWKNALPRLINYTFINIHQQTQTMFVSASAKGLHHRHKISYKFHSVCLEIVCID